MTGSLSHLGRYPPVAKQSETEVVIPHDEFRLTTSLAAIFLLNALVQAFDSPRQFPEPFEFLEGPLLFGGVVIGAIWVGMGYSHVLVRLSAYLLAMTVMFYLSGIEWFDQPWPWSPAYWIIFFGDSSTLVLLSAVLLLLAVSLPLFLCLISNRARQSRLSVAQLLTTTTCFALTIAIAVTWFPSKNWLLIYFLELLELFAVPSLATIYFMSAFVNLMIAYTGIFCLLRFRARHAWILATSFVSASFVTHMFFFVTRIAIPEFDATSFDALYMTGQTLVSILAVYILLDFVSGNDESRSNNLRDSSKLPSSQTMQING